MTPSRPYADSCTASAHVRPPPGRDPKAPVRRRVVEELDAGGVGVEERDDRALGGLRGRPATGMHVPPTCSTRRRVSSRLSTVRAVIATCAPSAAKWTAIALPVPPLLAPVTSAPRPLHARPGITQLPPLRTGGGHPYGRSTLRGCRRGTVPARLAPARRAGRRNGRLARGGRPPGRGRSSRSRRTPGGRQPAPGGRRARRASARIACRYPMITDPLYALARAGTRGV